MDQDVLRFDVTVHDAVAVGMFQGAQDSDRNLACQRSVEFSPFLDYFLQGLPLYVLHDKIAVFAVHTHVQQIDDIMVRHFAGRFGFPLETADKLAVFVEFGPQDLYRYVVACTQVNGTVNDGHTAHTDLFSQAVTVSKDLLLHSSVTPS